MSPEERNHRIFEASVGCSGAAVEFLRSVNKPLNVTYIAQTAWEIAKKLEEFMEVAIQRETAGPAATGAAATVVASGPKPGPEPIIPDDELIDIVDIAPDTKPAQTPRSGMMSPVARVG